MYKDVIQPQYRDVPYPVEVPIKQYRPVPVEKIVDRNVNIPVEVEMVQEFYCPRVQLIYKEIPVPVHVQRVVEHPIPHQILDSQDMTRSYYERVLKDLDRIH